MEEDTKIEEMIPPTPPPEDKAQAEKTQEESFQDKYVRSLAEMENMRKRMQREKQDVARFGIENAIAEFLPTIDNFENALRFADAASGEVKNWAVGFQMILSQFKEVLHNHGIAAFHSEGNTFDTVYHEAVEILETDEYPEGTVIQEFTRGYKSPTRVIRPARVKVSKQLSKTETPAEETIPAEEINQ
jgi:molecular chaperone GrpE